MNLITPVSQTDQRKHAQNIQMIAAEPWNIGKTTFFALFPGVFAPSDNFRAVAGTNANSPAAVIWNDAEMVIIGGGMVGVQNAQACANSWVGGYPYGGDRTMPSVFGDAWAAIVAVVPEIMSVAYTKITLMGHSFGGGTVTAGMALIQGIHRQIESWCYTYGSPRTSYPEGFANWRNVNLIRCWMDGDPVANCPPHTPELPLLTGILGQHAASNMNRIWHPRGGFQISDQGRLAGAEDATVGTVFELMSFTQWLSSSNMFASNRHSLTTYRTALSNGVSLVPPSANVNAPPHGDRVPVPPANELRGLIGRALQTAGRATMADLNQSILEILQRVTLVNGIRFRPRSVFGVRVIQYNGETVASCPRKRTRKLMIRGLNQYTRLSEV